MVAKFNLKFLILCLKYYFDIYYKTGIYTNNLKGILYERI